MQGLAKSKGEADLVRARSELNPYLWTPSLQGWKSNNLFGNLRFGGGKPLLNFSVEKPRWLGTSAKTKKPAWWRKAPTKLLRRKTSLVGDKQKKEKLRCNAVLLYICAPQLFSTSDIHPTPDISSCPCSTPSVILNEFNHSQLFSTRFTILNSIWVLILLIYIQ